MTKVERRRARMRGVVCTLTHAEWLSILEVHDHRCAYCLRHTSECGTLEQEHVIALSRGGEHTADNVVPGCGRCNASKGAKPVFMMAARLAA